MCINMGGKEGYWVFSTLFMRRGEEIRGMLQVCSLQLVIYSHTRYLPRRLHLRFIELLTPQQIQSYVCFWVFCQTNPFLYQNPEPDMFSNIFPTITTFFFFFKWTKKHHVQCFSNNFFEGQNAPLRKHSESHLQSCCYRLVETFLRKNYFCFSIE